MTTLTIPTRKVRRAAKAMTRKQSIKNWLTKFKEKFEVKEDGIDLRSMAENYDNGIIPLDDIHEGLKVATGLDDIEYNYNPQTDKHSPQFKYVSWDELFLWTLFQRDVAPNHVMRIIREFLHSCVSVPMAIKITVDGKAYYCVWDGHHTLQSMRFKGYNKFPLWFVDIDEVDITEVENAGFAPTTQGRIEYGVWLAGRNMININSKIKRALHPYDQFLIEVETKDARALSMTNILRKNNCIPKRHSGAPGAWTQIKAGIECYELATRNDEVTGQFWDRAVSFNRVNWPGMSLILEIFRPMSYLYQKAHMQGLVLDEQFDKELADALIKRYGDADSAQEAIKESFQNAVYNGQGSGNALNNHREIVMAGLINIYNQDVGRIALPPAEYIWKV